MKAFQLIFVVLLGIVSAGLASAQSDEGGELIEFNCPDANIFGSKMLSSVCWSCLFPIRIAGVPINSGSHNAPSRAANSSFCYCPGCGYIGRFGVTVGYWSPSRIVEVVEEPYCMPSLGGTTLGDLSPYVEKINVGRQGSRYGGEDRSDSAGLAHFHYYTYPILALLGLLDSYDCVDDGMSDFDLLWISEVFPNWTDDTTLSTYLAPESALFANPAAWLAQPIDCIAATAYRPVDALFWVSGCWGSHYPLTGRTQGSPSDISEASLRVSRALFLLHRIGMAKRQGGNDAVCKGQREPIMSKSFYRAQHFWPLPETESGSFSVGGDGSSDSPFNVGSTLSTCCHALGANSMAWGEWRKIPVVGEDYIQLIWRWMDCCVGVCI